MPTFDSAAIVARRALRPSEDAGRTIVFPIDLLNELQPHAARRGIHVNQLVRLIVEYVVVDGIVDAVLDDGGQPHVGGTG